MKNQDYYESEKYKQQHFRKFMKGETLEYLKRTLVNCCLLEIEDEAIPLMEKLEEKLKKFSGKKPWKKK